MNTPMNTPMNTGQRALVSINPATIYYCVTWKGYPTIKTRREYIRVDSTASFDNAVRGPARDG